MCCEGCRPTQPPLSQAGRALSSRRAADCAAVSKKPLWSGRRVLPGGVVSGRRVAQAAAAHLLEAKTARAHPCTQHPRIVAVLCGAIAAATPCRCAQPFPLLFVLTRLSVLHIRPSSHAPSNRSRPPPRSSRPSRSTWPARSRPRRRRSSAASPATPQPAPSRFVQTPIPVRASPKISSTLLNSSPIAPNQAPLPVADVVAPLPTSSSQPSIDPSIILRHQEVRRSPASLCTFPISSCQSPPTSDIPTLLCRKSAGYRISWTRRPSGRGSSRPSSASGARRARWRRQWRRWRPTPRWPTSLARPCRWSSPRLKRFGTGSARWFWTDCMILTWKWISSGDQAGCNRGCGCAKRRGCRFAQAGAGALGSRGRAYHPARGAGAASAAGAGGSCAGPPALRARRSPGRVASHPSHRQFVSHHPVIPIAPTHVSLVI